jgi:hypothetical protein
MINLAHLDRATATPIRRYEHPAPGDLVHVDIKKLATSPKAAGTRSSAASRGRRDRHRGRRVNVLSEDVPKSVEFRWRPCDH